MSKRKGGVPPLDDVGPAETGWRPHLLPGVLAAACLILMAFTPNFVTVGGGIAGNADSLPAMGLVLWLLDLVVVTGVALTRRAPRIALTLVIVPFAACLFTGTIPLGWWVALVMVAGIRVMDSWRPAVAPAVAAVLVAVVVTLTNVPLVKPGGPQYAVTPEVATFTTAPHGVEAGQVEAVYLNTIVQDADPDYLESRGITVTKTDDEVTIEVDHPHGAGSSSKEVIPTANLPRPWGWGLRLGELAAYLAAMAVVIGAFATVGAARRARAVRRAALRDQLAADAAARQAVALESAVAERARMARDLHDVVAHHISLVAVRAESARYAITDLPDDGRQAFADIADEARAALSELRQILAVLHRAEGEPGTEGTEPGAAAHRAPQPGAADIPGLIAAAAGAGQVVELLGEVPDLAPAQGLAAYRVVQESLTNARRHAPGTPTTVEIRRAPDGDECAVTVTNPLPGTCPRGRPPEPTGRGLIGMRERVESLGGTLTVTATEPPDARFVVDARLPLSVTLAS